jgi:hypothetical protein
LLWALNATTSYLVSTPWQADLSESITRSAFLPIEPVEPKIAIRLTIKNQISPLLGSFNLNLSTQIVL